MTTKREFEQRNHMSQALAFHGVTRQDFEALRHISMALHSWHERECGADNGCIERDEQTGKAYWLDSRSMKRYPIRDMEAGALKRLAGIMKQYPQLSAYVQTDPRGAALYILRPGDVPAGENAESYYTNGICVY